MNATELINKSQRRARISILKKSLSLYEKLKVRRELSIDEINSYISDLRELAKLNRIDRSEEDILYFMYEYFSDNRNPENEQNLIPIGITIKDALKNLLSGFPYS